MAVNDNYLKKIFFVLFGIFFIIILYFTFKLQNILVPIFIAFFTIMVLYPLINKLYKKGFPYWLSSLIVYLSFIIIVVIFIGILILSFSSFLKDLPAIVEKIKIKSGELAVLLLNLKAVAGFIDQDKMTSLMNSFSSNIISFENLSKYLLIPVNITIDVLSGFLLYAIALIFIIPGRAWISNRLVKAFSEKKGKRINEIVNNITEQFETYMVAKTFISFLKGLFTFLLCIIFKVKSPLMCGVVAFVVNFIPYIGPFLAEIFPVMLLLILDSSLVRILMFSASALTMQTIVGNIVEPKYMSTSGVNLSAIVIYISFLIWGYIWGIAGIVLAVPITSALNIIFENIPQLKPISVLMSSRKKLLN